MKTSLWIYKNPSRILLKKSQVSHNPESFESFHWQLTYHKLQEVKWIQDSPPNQYSNSLSTYWYKQRACRKSKLYSISSKRPMTYAVFFSMLWMWSTKSPNGVMEATLNEWSIKITGYNLKWWIPTAIWLYAGFHESLSFLIYNMSDNYV